MPTDPHGTSLKPPGKPPGDIAMPPSVARPESLHLVPHPEVQRINVLGVGISAINIPMALDFIDQWISVGARRYVCITGVHGVMESQRDESVRQIHNAAGLVTPDGMPLVWLLKLGGHGLADRVYGPDLMLACFARGCETGYCHFLYGSSEANLAKLRANLESHFPAARIVGTHSPPFRALTEQEDAEIVGIINASEADIVWVGLSTPKQEKWMAEHRNWLRAPVLIGVGAAFDFNAGVVRQAPRFVQRSGFEWLFRTMVEPRRLWKRYAVNNPCFLWGVAQQALRLKKFSIDDRPEPQRVSWLGKGRKCKTRI